MRLFWKEGMVPVMVILGGAGWGVVAVVEMEAAVERVGVRGRGGGGGEGEVHQMPKLAMERYIYFAGRVNDNVGVTCC
jgi:hypothetical protein